MDFRGILFLTHSSRLTLLRFCSQDFLTRRFSAPNRLKHLPPFENLPPLKPHRFGAVTLFRVSLDEAGGRLDCARMGTLKRRHRIQSVTALGASDLLVGFESRLEHWRCRRALGALERVHDRDFVLVRAIFHPLLAGVRSVQPLDERRAVVSCSGLDGILVVNWRSGEVEQVLRLPCDLYGFNYDLGPKTDLRLHYVNNNRQTTHVNGAWPLPGGKSVLVSTLIQGAIGRFDLESGDYTEITQGFIGCHGVRINSSGQTYFADSCQGRLVFLDDKGAVTRQFETGSKWLHDVTQIGDDIYAFSMADSNELHFYDIGTGERLYQRQFVTSPHPLLAPFYRWFPGWIGNSTLFVSFSPAAQ